MTTQTNTRNIAADAATPAPSKCCGHHDAFAILHDCHEHILERLARLETLGRELVQAPSIDGRHFVVLGDVLTFLDVAVPMHSADEEQTLFPRLRESLGPTAGPTPMDCMEREHSQHQGLLVALKRAVVKRDATAAGRAALAIVSAYREHIGKEEEVLFPWARKTLADPVVVEGMTRQMRQRRVDAGMLSC